jgi:ABC-type bacteriocin/lantibiotic exporter with double-glycine peptidase domain
MTKFLNVKPFRQTPGRCGPASLKIVLEYYGITISESELTKITKCNKSGTRAHNIVKAAKILGMDAHIKDNSTLEEVNKLIYQGIPIIIDWFLKDEGHYSVVAGMDKEHIYLQDPELGKLRKIDRQTFQRVWFDFEGEYIKDAKDLILRRIIVIKRKAR